MSRLRGKSANFAYLDEVNDPMNLRNNVVARAYIKDTVLCSVMCGDDVKAVEEHKSFNAADYARQAYAKFGKCRVMFFNPAKIGFGVKYAGKTAMRGHCTVVRHL